MTDAAPKFDLAVMADTVAASNRGLRVELISPADQSKTGIFITVLGKDSDVFREALREGVDAANRRAQQARLRGKAPPIQTQEEVEAESTDLLVISTLAWENMVVDGVDLPLNVPNAKMVYTRFPWIRKQVDDAIGDIEGFLKNQLTN